MRQSFVRMTIAALVTAAAASAMGSAAHADAPATFEVHVDFDAINPCSGEPHTVSFDAVASVHSHDNNLVEHLSRTGTTDSGFVMDHGTSQFVETERIARQTLVDVWYHPETGERFLARFTVVLDKASERFLVDSFVTLRCLAGGEKSISPPL